MGLKGKLVAAFAAAAVLGGVGGCGASMNSFYEENTVRITVNDKERVQDGKTSKYLVYTDQEVFEDSDSLIKWKFDSSDVYAQLKKDCTYDATVIGWRVHPLSMYRNILDAQHVPTKACPKAPPKPH